MCSLLVKPFTATIMTVTLTFRRSFPPLKQRIYSDEFHPVRSFHFDEPTWFNALFPIVLPIEVVLLGSVIFSFSYPQGRSSFRLQRFPITHPPRGSSVVRTKCCLTHSLEVVIFQILEIFLYSHPLR